MTETRAGPSADWSSQERIQFELFFFGVGVGFKLIKKRFGWFLASGDEEACTIIKQLHSSIFRAGYTIPFIECIVHL